MRLHFSSGVVDTVRRTVEVRQEQRRLREKEAQLLDYLAARPHETISRQTLLSEVFEFSPQSRTSTLATTIRRLRSALALVGGEGHVQSVYGVGYRFVPPTRPAAETMIGRDAELDALTKKLAVHRLVSVVAWGGTGKTTLVRAYLRRQTGVFCSLANVGTAAGVHDMVVHALELEATTTPQTLVHALRARGEMVLVLDEAERVAGELVACVTDWLEACPALRLLVTSRRTLGHPQEVLVKLGPLAPRAAAALMIRRAQAMGLELDRDAAERTTALLDRHPLSIELAVGRLQVLTPAQLEQTLRNGLGSLISGPRADLDQVMRESIELLEPSAAAALRRIAVCEGVFDLARVERMVDRGRDHLQTLAEHHLLAREGRGFRLHRAVREAAVRMSSPRELEETHKRWFACLLEESEHLEHAPSMVELQSAVERAPRGSEVQARLAVALGSRWQRERRRPEQLGAWLPEVDAAHPEPLRARLMLAWAHVHRDHAPERAVQLADQALGLLTEISDRVVALELRGACRLASGDRAGALADVDALLGILRTTDHDRVGTAVLIMGLRYLLGDYEGVREVAWSVDAHVSEASPELQQRFHGSMFTASVRRCDLSGVFEASEAELAAVQDASPHVQVWSEQHRCAASFLRGDHRQALADTEELLHEVRGRSAWLETSLRCQRTSMQIELGLFDHVMPEIRAAQRSAQGHVRATALAAVYRAEAARILGALDEARHRFDTLVPGSPHAHFLQRAMLAVQEGRLEEGLAMQRLVVERCDSRYATTMALGRLAELLVIARRDEEAEVLLRQALSSDLIFHQERWLMVNILSALRKQPTEQAPNWRHQIWAVWGARRRGEPFEARLEALRASVEGLPAGSIAGWLLSNLMSRD